MSTANLLVISAGNLKEKNSSKRDLNPAALPLEPIEWLPISKLKNEAAFQERTSAWKLEIVEFKARIVAFIFLESTMKKSFVTFQNVLSFSPEADRNFDSRIGKYIFVKIP